MPIQNTQGALSVGRDVSLVLIAGQYGRVDMPNATDFQCAQETAPINSDRLDGVQLRAEIPKGWRGSFSADRGGPQLDNFIAYAEALWFNSGGLIVGTLYEYVTEPDGSTSTFQYDNVSLKLDDAGTWRGDSKVTQRMSFMANRRRRV